MSVYVSYSDEGATGDPTGRFVVGGYVSEENNWADFSAIWAKEVLNSHPPIPYVHMVELRSKDFRNERGLLKDDGDRKVSDAVDIVVNKKSVSAHFGSIHRGELQTVYKKILNAGFKCRERLKEPDYMCFLAYAWKLIEHLEEHESDVTKINFVVEKNKHVTHYYVQFRDEMRSFMEEKYPKRAALVGDLIPVSMELHMPLQAADVLCWHLQRFYSHTLAPEDKINFEKLNKNMGLHKEWDYSELEEFADRIIKNNL